MPSSISRTDLLETVKRLPPNKKRELDALLADVDPWPASFRDFIGRVQPPRFVWHKHITILTDAFERVAAGVLKRLMVFMPPQRGKSQTISQLGAAYYLRRHPDRWVGLTSYGADLAYTHSRAARRYYGADAGLSDERAGVEQWETKRAGGMWATGIRGSATGKPMALGIVDDPLKDAQEAASETIRQRNLDWYDSVFTQRLHKDGALIVIQTRWHERDLAGELLERERREAQGWHVLVFQSLYEPGYAWDWPESITVAPDWRSNEDENLCPAMMGTETLQQMRRESPYFFAAMHQQHPQPREGGTFQRAWFEIVSSAPGGLPTVRFWDRAATKGGGDFTAGVKISRSPEGVYTILDVVRGQWDSGTRDKKIRRTAEADGAGVKQYGEQEPGSAGKDAALAFVRLLDGFPARCVPSTGDKEVRADPLASSAQGGNVKLLRGLWNQAFLDELTAFPTGAHDDQVDACAGAFNMLAKRQVLAVSPGGSEQEDWRQHG